MIKLIDSIGSIICKAETLYNPFLTKIISIYENERAICDALLYTQTDSCNEQTAYLLNADSSFTVFCLEGSNLTEIEDFIQACRYSTVLSNVTLDLNSTFKRGKVMKRLPASSLNENSDSLTDYEMKGVYCLLKDNFDYIPDYSEWYSDMSHRMRHSGAFVVGEHIDDIVASCAVCPYLTDNSAIVNGVCTDKKYRKRGLAGRCVEKAVGILIRKGIDNIYILCRDELERFYKNNGFEKCGEWYEYIRQI